MFAIGYMSPPGSPSRSAQLYSHRAGLALLTEALSSPTLSDVSPIRYRQTPTRRRRGEKRPSGVIKWPKAAWDPPCPVRHRPSRPTSARATAMIQARFRGWSARRAGMRPPPPSQLRSTRSPPPMHSSPQRLGPPSHRPPPRRRSPPPRRSLPLMHRLPARRLWSRLRRVLR